MAIQFLVGIPWLASVIAAGFVAIFSWFLQFMTKRLALVGAAIVVVVALTTGLFAALEALVATIALAMPSEMAVATGLFLPANLTTCISVIVTAHLLRFAYEWNVKIIQWKLF